MDGVIGWGNGIMIFKLTLWLQSNWPHSWRIPGRIFAPVHSALLWFPSSQSICHCPQMDTEAGQPCSFYQHCLCSVPSMLPHIIPLFRAHTSSWEHRFHWHTSLGWVLLSLLHRPCSFHGTKLAVLHYLKMLTPGTRVLFLLGLTLRWEKSV